MFPFELSRLENLFLFCVIYPLDFLHHFASQVNVRIKNLLEICTGKQD